ncbi:MAG: sigma-54-dependent Fis family transcriptional regulator, partial [Myxococcales bacterium]
SFLAGGTVIAVVPGRCDEDDDASDEPPLDGVIGQSLPMRRLARAVRKLAALRAPVLIRGETGTGKELVARALHQLGPRGRGPFVPINMGSISPDLADGELFGHERGAFTGAVASRLGAFESARGGTLFLDEVAELPPLAQSKLLRALENGEVRPLGTSQPRQVDVRVVAASWASLEELMPQGAFREDLFHRLAVLTVQVPPLRARPIDIALLARHFLASQASEVGSKTLTGGAISRLSAHPWPGNVRELKNVLLRAAVTAVEPSITSEHIDQALAPFQSAPQPSLDQRRREAQRALDQHRGNRSGAARSLGVARSTFRDWVAPREGGKKKR